MLRVISSSKLCRDGVIGLLHLISEPERVATELVISASESITRITFEEEHEERQDATDASRATWMVSKSLRMALLAAALVAVSLALFGGGWLLWQHWLDQTTGQPVAIVLTPLDGTTGDTVLDGALVDGLRIDIAQSPFVSLVSPARVRATLIDMHRPTEPLTASLAREVCERTNSQVVLHGRIARAGQHFLLTEEAASCVDGTVLAQAKQEVNSAEALPHGIDQLAESVRRKLGESRRTIARFDTPLFSANTASLEALKEYSQGVALANQGKYPDAISLLQKAVAADPSFAAGFYQLAVNEWNNENFAAERDAIEKAYALRDGASEPFRLAITSLYHLSVTQDLYESERNYRNWTEQYPRAGQAWNGLSSVQRDLGHQRDSLVSSQHTLALIPDQQGDYTNLAYSQMQTGDLKGAEATCEAAIAKGLDGDHVRWHLLEIAYALNDASLIQKQVDWIAAHPEAPFVREQEAEIAMARGRISEAHGLLVQVDAILRHQGLPGTADYDEIAEGGNLMEVGDFEGGKRMFRSVAFDFQERSALKAEAGVVGLVQVGDIVAAKNVLHSMQAEFPRGTLWNEYVGPEVEALAAMAEHRPKDAIALLERARPLEGRGTSIPKLRADAYLAAGEPALAEDSYREVVKSLWQGPESFEIPLSWLGLARALAAQGKRPAAIDAYQHFLTLWAHADPDAIYFQQAKQELGRIQRGGSAQ